MSEGLQSERRVVLTHQEERVVFAAALSGAPEKAVEKLDGKLQDIDEVLQYAQCLRESCAAVCVFCDTPNTHKTGWLEMSWGELRNVACSCVTSTLTSRKVMYPNWEKRVETIVSDVKKGRLSADRVLYTDVCSTPGCYRPFRVTAQHAVKQWEKYGVFRGWNHCQACVLAKKRTDAEVAKMKKAVGKVPDAPMTPPPAPAGGDVTIAVRRAPKGGKNALRVKLGELLESVVLEEVKKRGAKLDDTEIASLLQKDGS